MSCIAKTYEEIIEECNSLQKKKIQKPKRRNQYTIDFRFGSNINASKLKNSMEINLCLPPCIAQKLSVRFQSNIQFPSEFNQEVKLGNLQVDPHSYNYKIVRLDKKDKMTIFTLESIEHPFTPIETFLLTLQQCNPRLAQSFRQFNDRNLDLSTYQPTPQLLIDEFEKSLNQPYTCYLHRLKNGICNTIQRIVNDKFLDLLAISDQMLEDHVLKNNLLPFSTFLDKNDDFYEMLSSMFDGNVKQDVRTRELMNYNGQIFTTRVQNKSFFAYNTQENAYYEYSFYIYDCDPRWLSKSRALRNSEEYFNEKLFKNEKLRTRFVSEDSSNSRSCGIKNKNE